MSLPTAAFIPALACTGALFSASFASAQPPSPPPGSRPAPAVVQVGPAQFRLRDILIDKSTRSISFPAQVNMARGLLEYLLVASTGKTHESLLRTSVDPYLMNVSLLLLGFEGASGRRMGQGGLELPRGEPVEISVALGEQISGSSISCDDWVEKRTAAGVESPGLRWVYTGSTTAEGRFLAQVEGSIVALYRDAAALVDNAAPGGESDEVWYAKEGSVPAPGTPVTVTVRSLKGVETPEGGR